MVLLCGYDIEKTTLPYYGAIEYIIKSTIVEIKMLHCTKLLEKSSEICIVPELTEYIPEKYHDKMQVIEDETVLVKYLANETETEIAETGVEQVEKPSTHKRKASRKPKSQEIKQNVEIIDAKPSVVAEEELHIETTQVNQLQQDLAKAENEIQVLTTEIETLNLMISDQTTEITQLEGKAAEQSATIQELSAQNAEYKQIIEDIDKTDIDAVNDKIAEIEYLYAMVQNDKKTLEEKVNELEQQLTTERIQFETDKATYEQMLEDVEQEQQKNVGYSVIDEYGTCTCRTIKPQVELKEYPNFSVIMCAGSTEQVLSAIQQNILQGLDGVLIDMTGSSQISMALRLTEKQKERGDIRTLMAGGETGNIVQKRVNTDIVMSEAYYDIMLYKIDWEHFLANVAQYAGARKVYLLLGNITSFAVKYTFTQLTKSMKGHIVVPVTPNALFDLLKDVVTMPPKQFDIVCIQYVVGTLKNFLDRLIQNHTVKFVNDGEKLDIDKI